MTGITGVKIAHNPYQVTESVTASEKTIYCNKKSMQFVSGITIEYSTRTVKILGSNKGGSNSFSSESIGVQGGVSTSSYTISGFSEPGHTHSGTTTKASADSHDHKVTVS